jgi:methyltransferase (TIGR00027 family)
MSVEAHVVLRSRYCEDRLAIAVQRGVSQYIILGAGFDTFVFRQPSWAASLRIVEVDHPGTQERERSYMVQAGLEMPKNAGFAQVDFEHESLLDGLSRHHISMDQRTFFSWLGVTMYLNESAIDAALNCMARFPQGSEVVLTFRGPVPRELDASMRARAELARHVASLGEPFVSFFEPDAVKAKLLSAGFITVNFLRPEEAEAQYFRGRPGDIPAPRGIRIASAIR